MQFSSAAGYLTEVSHVIWDIHEGDVLVKLDPPNLMLLDVFMRPDEMLGKNLLHKRDVAKNADMLCNKEQRMSAHSAPRASLRRPEATAAWQGLQLVVPSCLDCST